MQKKLIFNLNIIKSSNPDVSYPYYTYLKAKIEHNMGKNLPYSVENVSVVVTMEASIPAHACFVCYYLRHKK